MEDMFQPLRKYADFNGRARRREYWLFYLLFFIVQVALVGATGGFEEGAPDPTGVALIVTLVAGLLILGLILPMLAVTVRRLHDSGRTGWWMLIAFVPLIGGLVLFVYTVLDGTPGANRFGQDPKGRALTDVSVFT